MLSRQFVWTDARLHKLAENFVPCVQDEWPFWNSPDTEEKRWLLKVYKQGHYRDVTDFNYQGTYVVTPAGKVLASDNIVKDPAAAVKLLEDGLAQWKRLTPKERLLPEPPDPKVGPKKPFADLYPADGLVLRVVQRRLPDAARKKEDETAQYNLDFAWYRKAEARRFLPEKLEKGARHEVPRELVERLARFAFLDNLPGIISERLNPERVKKAALTAEVVAVKGDVAEVRFEGETQTASGVNDCQYGYEGALRGRATYSTKEQKFLTFELVAVGRGARGNLGFVCHQAGGGPGEKQPPRFIAGYRWKKE